MDNEMKYKIWDAINVYAIECGGNPEKHIHSVSRMDAVASVEKIYEAQDNHIVLLRAHIDELNAERRRDALAGQGTLDEASNRITILGLQIEKMQRRIWECDVCGKKDVWGKTWGNHVSRKHIPTASRKYSDPEIVAVVCSDECYEKLTDEIIDENLKTGKYCHLEWMG